MEEELTLMEQNEKEKSGFLHLKRIVEALLFSSSDPLSWNKIRDIINEVNKNTPVSLQEVRLAAEELKKEYAGDLHAFRLDEIAEGLVLRTRGEFSPYLRALHRNKRKEKLSQGSLEVLAIIAYRQPVTRLDIEAIRGVDSSGVLAQLIEKELVCPAGKLQAPGRPTLYATTKEFLIHFGIKNCQELEITCKEKG